MFSTSFQCFVFGLCINLLVWETSEWMYSCVLPLQNMRHPTIARTCECQRVLEHLTYLSLEIDDIHTQLKPRLYQSRNQLTMLTTKFQQSFVHTIIVAYKCRIHFAQSKSQKIMCQPKIMNLKKQTSRLSKNLKCFPHLSSGKHIVNIMCYHENDTIHIFHIRSALMWTILELFLY